MSVDRFKGEEGMAFIGSGYTEEQTAEIHMYAGRNHQVLTDRFKVEDIVAAVNALPGVTATYTPPELTLADLEPGTAFTFRNGTITYVVLQGRKMWSDYDSLTYDIIPRLAVREVEVIS